MEKWEEVRERAELVCEAASVDSDGGSGDWAQCKDVRGPSLIP